MRFAVRVLLLAVWATVFLLGIEMGTAFATHEHIVGHIGHGLGDGVDNDFYRHPSAM